MASESADISNECFRRVAQDAEVALVLVNGDGKIFFWNEAAKMILGYEEQEILQKDWFILIDEHEHGSEQAVFSRDLRTIPSNAPRISAEMRGVRKDGRRLPLKISFSSWSIGGAAIHCISFKDLSQIQNTQKRALAQERLAAVGQLAAGIAHDFNNLLVPINLYSEMVLRDQGLNSNGREMMETIRRQVNRARTLTEQILDFSRKQVMDFRTVDLRHELRQLTRLLNRILPESIAIDFRSDSGRYIVRADPARLQQVFMNLALNARDAMQEGGILSIEISKLNVAPKGPPPYRDMAPGDWTRIKVSDTGMGINEHHLHRIFEPFFTTKDPGKGTGLGLAQVYGIVKQHGGYIDVQSEEMTGTTMVIYFPLQPEEPNINNPSKRLPYSKGDQESILVVEDNKEALKATCAALESLNYRVTATSSGKQAMEIYRAESIDLVLSDLVMPEMSGIELYKALREINAEVKVVVMTGYPLGTGTRELLESGKVTWLHKPMDAEKIAQVIQRTLQS